jgi:uncharacterized protein (TIGR00645 family)
MENQKQPQVKSKNNGLEIMLESVLLSSKWLLVPFYLGLMLSLAVYTYTDIVEIFELFRGINKLNSEDAMMAVLTLIDLTMIANLVKLIIVGSYTSFFKKHSGEDKNDPNLNTSSGVLKVKIATAIIGVSSITLLKTFERPDTVNMDTLHKQLLIHGMFIIGSVMLAVIDIMHVKAEALHHEDCRRCEHDHVVNKHE